MEMSDLVVKTERDHEQMMERMAVGDTPLTKSLKVIKQVTYRDEVRAEGIRHVDGEEYERPLPQSEMNDHLRLFIDSVLTQVFQECRLKAKKQKQMLDLLKKNPRIAKHLAF